MISSQKVRAILMLLLVVWGTAVISATAQTSQELELGNNKATAELFIGRRLYLPSVAR